MSDLIQCNPLVIKLPDRDLIYRLSIGSYERLGLAGRSGCGKSLFAKALLGLLPRGLLASGAVSFKDQDLLKVNGSIRGSEIGLCLQDPMTALNPLMSVGRQVREVFTTHLSIRGKEAKKRVIELFQMVGLEERVYSLFPHMLSGGMRQRVVIAMGIALSPSLLILDEVTTGLDPETTKTIIDLLKEIQEKKKMSLLFISHDEKLMESFCDRVVHV